MKKTFLSALRGMMACALAVCAIACFTACSSDDDPTTTDPQTFNGNLTTTVPSMPTFEPLTEANTVVVTWGNPEQTSATVKLGAFKIAVSTPMGNKAYEIGEMNISNVICKKAGKKISFSHPAFECQAGNFATTGTLEGSLDNGTINLTIVYKPGSMPFDVQSVFVGK